MNRLIVIIIILVFTSCSVSRQVVLSGKFEETNWGPMWEKYIFTNDGIFLHYYGDDTHGSFDKGKFELIGRKLDLDYDSLIVDKPILSNTKKAFSDSLTIDFTLKSLSHDIIQIYNESKLLEEVNFKSDTLTVKIKRPCDILRVVVLCDYITKKEKLYDFDIDVSGMSKCFIDYFPSNSWYKFNKRDDETIKLKKLSETNFEIHRGEYKWIFKKD